MRIPFRGAQAAPLDPTLVAPMSTPANPELTSGRRIGVLVVHGFTGSPASMRPWAEDLAARGYAVEMPLLPGHGTRWQDMNKVRWTDWTATVEGAFDKLAAENDTVVAVGLSMGGALSLRLAADRGEELAGVVLVNAAVDSMRKDAVLLPVLKRFVPAFPGIRNDIKKPGMDEIAYPVIPLKAAYEMSGGWAELRRDLPRITIPVLYFRSKEDHVADISSSKAINAGLSSKDFEERVLEDSYHVATLDNDAPRIFAESAEFIERVTAQKQG
ncbi:alpha/beta hydrolase [Nocardioides pinisoli]|uniref:Alpha/beta fold hydrolase n=1 Tax=Nocardioides pinisoli TaxID=2950279 RepID=A0ABT1KTW2_9ACTN|nr:alpha/beta fold hydrolase [Nocardioides pinisoli]MCP3421174.1 alpha/beta fold hydrolase [Nocardioides pinisoli]